MGEPFFRAGDHDLKKTGIIRKYKAKKLFVCSLYVLGVYIK